MQLGSAVLGGGFYSSRLSIHLRKEAGLVYSVGSNLQIGRTRGIYLIDFANFPTMNQLYAEAMGDHRPARTTVQVAALPKGGLVEIDLVARRS